MFKKLSLKLSVLIKKAIIRFYPLAVNGRECVSWRKVSKVSVAFFLYPVLVFLLAVIGLESVARFMISPFAPVDKSNIWFFFTVVSVPLILPLASAVVYWLPKFLTSRFATPFFKAAIITLALSPFIFLFLMFASYIAAVTFVVLWFVGGAHYEAPHDPDHGRNPFADPLHSEYLLHNIDDPI